jgi:hypothetical protein
MVYCRSPKIRDDFLRITIEQRTYPAFDSGKLWRQVKPQSSGFRSDDSRQEERTA